MLSLSPMYPPSRSPWLFGLFLLLSCTSPSLPSTSQAVTQAASAPREVAFVIQLEGHPSVVLAQEVPRSWTAAPAALVSGEDVVTVRKDVAVSLLPEAIRAELGKTVTLVGTHGNMCTARIGAPSLVARIVAEGPTADAAEEESDPVLRAARIWESEVADHQLVATLVPLRGDCAGALYAKHEADARVWAAPAAPTGPQEQIARSAFRALPQYHDMSEARDTENEDGAAVLPPEPTVRTFDADGVRYYFVSEGEESLCGVQNVGALFRADRAETPRELELVAVSTELAGDVVGVVHDARSDEVHVLYTDYELRIRGGHEPDQRRTVRVPFEGCGC